MDAARHDGYLTGNRRAMTMALLRSGAYLLKRGETDQGRKLLTQAVEAGAGHGYEGLAADALALLGQEAEAQALRKRAEAETITAWWPALAFRLGLTGPADNPTLSGPAAGPDPAAAQMGAALMQTVLGRLVDNGHTSKLALSPES